MQMNILKNFWVLVFVGIASVFLQTTVVASPREQVTGVSNLVSGVYDRYAWVAVFSKTPSSNAVPLALASRAELEKVFAPDLAKAIWSDAQCADKAKEVCALDFDILFDSQDPSARDLTVQADPQSSLVSVCFEISGGSRKCLSFVGVYVKGAPRVADIIYSDKRTLRQILGLAKK